jgi:hypothetical protein
VARDHDRDLGHRRQPNTAVGYDRSASAGQHSHPMSRQR